MTKKSKEDYYHSEITRLDDELELIDSILEYYTKKKKSIIAKKFFLLFVPIFTKKYDTKQEYKNLLSEEKNTEKQIDKAKQKRKKYMKKIVDLEDKYYNEKEEEMEEKLND